MQKPRSFNHSMIFADEHRDRLRMVEQRARHELGMATADKDYHAAIHGAFSAIGRQHRHRLGWAATLPVALSLLLIIAAVVLLVIYS